MPLPTKVQQGAFGSVDAAPAGGTITPGRTPPRPAVLRRGTAQGLEQFGGESIATSPEALARALNRLQRAVHNSTQQARANPMGEGHLYQNVPLKGPPMAGTSAQAPNRSDAIVGQQYFDTTLVIPLFFNNNNWNIASGPVQYAAPAGNATYTTIDHGVGSPAVGAMITGLQGGTIAYPIKIVPAGDATDNVRVRLWAPIYGSPVADIYLFF